MDFNEEMRTWFAAIDQIRENGPTRVVINARGMAVDPHRALRDYAIKPDVVLIRNDGWSLGAPHQFREVALRMWADQWVAIWDTSEDVPTLI